MSERSGLIDAAIAFAIRVMSAVLVFGLQILLARLMPLSGYGDFVTLWTWLLALGSFAAIGFAESGVRFLPRYRARGRERQVLGFWRFGLITVVAASCTAPLFAVMAGWLLGLEEGAGLLVLLVGLGLPFLALEYYLGGIARSFGWFQLITLPVYILRPLLIAGICLGLAASGIPLTFPIVGIVVVGSMALVAMGIALAIASRLRAAKSNRPEPVSARQRKLWLFASLPLLLASGLEDLLTYSDVVILSLMLSADHVGLYFAAARALALANFVTYALFLVSGRQFALDLAEQERSKLQQSVLATSRLTFWMTLVAVAGTLVAGPLLLAAFGPQFVAAFPVMLILGAGMMARSLAGQAGELLVVAGRQKELILLSLVVLTVNLALTVALVPLFGISGAAISTAFAMALRAFFLVLVVRRVEGLRVVSLALPKLGRP